MNMAAEARRAPAIEIRFGPVDLTQLQIRTTDPGVLLDELTGRVATAPRFFERAAVCLDLSGLERVPEVAELRVVLDAVKRAGMLAVGLAHGTPAVESLARALELPVLAQFRAPARPAPTVQPVEAPEPAALPALMHTQPVRSGQRIYARQRDFIVNAPVGAGAEVIADGCVHIYGPLRGRAMAGARGEATARVFCQEFHAELVSIAGVFRVFETLPAELIGAPVQAWLADDVLHFARIGG